MSNENTPYAVPGLCGGKWPNWEHRAELVAAKATYRATMIVETYFGPVVVRGRSLDGPVRLARGYALGKTYRSEFEVVQRRRKPRPQPGIEGPKPRPWPGGNASRCRSAPPPR